MWLYYMRLHASLLMGFIACDHVSGGCCGFPPPTPPHQLLWAMKLSYYHHHVMHNRISIYQKHANCF